MLAAHVVCIIHQPQLQSRHVVTHAVLESCQYGASHAHTVLFSNRLLVTVTAPPRSTWITPPAAPPKNTAKMLEITRVATINSTVLLSGPFASRHTQYSLYVKLSCPQSAANRLGNRCLSAGIPPRPNTKPRICAHVLGTPSAVRVEGQSAHTNLQLLHCCF